MDLKERYIQGLIALRPRGKIWEVKPGSVTMRKIEIQAEYLAKVHQMAEDLLKEAYPGSVEFLLENWENAFGLPHTGTFEERLATLNAEAAAGLYSRFMYIDLCATLGVTIEIREHYPFVFGLSAFGEKYECGVDEIVFWWTIVIKKADSEAAVAKMKQFIGKYKQSHTLVKYEDERTN